MDETKILVTSTFNQIMQKIIYHYNLKSSLGKLLLIMSHPWIVQDLRFGTPGTSKSTRWRLRPFRSEFRQEKFMFVSRGDVIRIIQEKAAESGIRSEKQSTLIFEDR